MCKVTDAVLIQDAAAVAKAITSIANAVQVTDPSLAAELNTAANTLVAATDNWKTGDPVTDINTAATAIEDVLAVIPVTAPYATFVAIAVSALDILIGNLATQNTQTANVVANAQAVQAHVEALKENPYRGVVAIRPSIFGIRHAVISRWNKQVELQPEVGFKKL